MTEVVYKIVEHDGGWAYKVGDVLSETFASHDEALQAARSAAERSIASVTTRSARGSGALPSRARSSAT